MRGLHLLTLGDYVFVFYGMSGEVPRAMMVGHALVQPWVPMVEEMLQALAPVPKGVDGDEAHPDDVAGAASAPAQAAQGVALKPLDRVAEASVRVVRGGIKTGQDQALSREDLADAEQWAEANAHLFPDGLAFLGASLPEQVGETVRLIGRARAQEVAWLHARWRVHGQTFAEAVAAVEASNGALHKALTSDAPAEVRLVTQATLRRQAQRLLSELLPVLSRAFPASDPKAAAARAALLSPVHERVAFRVARHAARKHAKAQADSQAQAPAPAQATQPAPANAQEPQ